MKDALKFIQQYINQPEQKISIEQLYAECGIELGQNEGQGMAYRVISGDLNFTGAGSVMKSLWLFAFRPNGESDIHKHSNSTQYTCTWSGLGAMRLGSPANAKNNVLSGQSIGHDPASDWIIIPPGTYHQAIAGDN